LQLRGKGRKKKSLAKEKAGLGIFEGPDGKGGSGVISGKKNNPIGGCLAKNKGFYGLALLAQGGGGKETPRLKKKPTLGRKTPIKDGSHWNREKKPDDS